MIDHIILGIFCVLHGLVHLLYFGQSTRYFELQPDMIWPNGAWIFSKLMGDETVRMLANLGLAIAVVGFVVGGAGLVFGQIWAPSLIISVSIFSTALYIFLWDGKFQNLPDKGGVGILINLAILVVLLFMSG